MIRHAISRGRANVPIRVRERIVQVERQARKKAVVAITAPKQEEPRHRLCDTLIFIYMKLSGGRSPVPPRGYAAWVFL